MTPSPGITSMPAARASRSSGQTSGLASSESGGVAEKYVVPPDPCRATSCRRPMIRSCSGRNRMPGAPLGQGVVPREGAVPRAGAGPPGRPQAVAELGHTAAAALVAVDGVDEEARRHEVAARLGALGDGRRLDRPAAGRDRRRRTSAGGTTSGSPTRATGASLPSRSTPACGLDDPALGDVPRGEHEGHDVLAVGADRAAAPAAPQVRPPLRVRPRLDDRLVGLAAAALDRAEQHHARRGGWRASAPGARRHTPARGRRCGCRPAGRCRGR